MKELNVHKRKEKKMYTVIMAGGKGTRIASVRADVPKPMIPVCGKPILEHQLEVLRRQGCTEVIMVIGHLGDCIKQYFASGERYGVSVTYLEEEQPLGTAGALYYLKEIIQEDFLLLNGDIIFDIDIARMLSYHRRKGGTATILTHPNSHPYDSGLVVTDRNGKVEKWLAKEEERDYYRNRVNAGIHMLSPKVFEYFLHLQKLDLDRDILKKLIPFRQLYAYASPEYVKDMGTPERYAQVEQDMRTGKVRMKNLHEKQKAFFLDRDGILCMLKNPGRNAGQVELCPGAIEAVRYINDSGYLAIMVTSRALAVNGETSFEEEEHLMDKLETLLGAGGAYLDDRFYCPQPELLYQAAGRYHIDLKCSYIIRKRINGIKAGEDTGYTACLLNGYAGNSCGYDDLLECIKSLLIL